MIAFFDSDAPPQSQEEAVALLLDMARRHGYKITPELEAKCQAWVAESWQATGAQCDSLADWAMGGGR